MARSARPRAERTRERLQRRYHHGDLRQALLRAAESVLSEVGIDRFTLRECARRAGVSHGAPAHHFGDVQGLLSELTADSFEQLSALMERYRKAAAGDAFAQLEATGLAYLDYALAHPARFQLMFRTGKLDPDHARLSGTGQRAYGHLEATIAAVDAAVDGDGKLLAEKAALGWSLAHGFANLMLDNGGFAARTGESAESARRMLARLIRLCRPAFEARQAPPDQDFFDRSGA